MQRSFVERRDLSAPVHAYLDEPYGSPSHLFEARFAVMIAGIGVTPFASILESISQCEPKTLGRLERAHFFWLNRDQYSFEWLAALLARSDFCDLQLARESLARSRCCRPGCVRSRQSE